MTKSRITALALAFVLFAFPAATAYAGFNEVVAAIEARGGHSKSVVPLFGLVRMAVWISHPAGVHDIELALWEDHRFSIDASEVEPLIRTNAGRDYRPMVAARSRNGEWSLIYARPAGNLVDMLVVTHDHSDTVVVHTVIDPDRLGAEIAKHNRGHGHVDVAWR